MPGSAVSRTRDGLIAAGFPGGRFEVVPAGSDPGQDLWMPSLLNRARRHGSPVHERVDSLGLTAEDAARLFPVRTFFTTFDLYVAFHRHGFELFRDNALSVLRGTAVAVPQDDPKANMVSRGAIDFEDPGLERFDVPIDEVREWCRSLAFRPRQ